MPLFRLRIKYQKMILSKMLTIKSRLFAKSSGGVQLTVISGAMLYYLSENIKQHRV